MLKPWFKIPDPISTGAHIAIVGGGIAGVATYLHFKMSGYKTTLIESNDRLLSCASGNPAAILEPFLSATETSRKIFYLEAYHYARKFYKNLNDNIYRQTELIKIPKDDQDAARFQKISNVCDPDIARLQGDNLHLPKSGYVIPEFIRTHVSDYPNILLNKRITRMEYTGKWELFDQNDKKTLEADAIILCNAHDISHLEQTKHIEMDAVHGRVTCLKPKYRDNHIISSKKYLTPAVQTEYGLANICGATFEREDSLKTRHEADMDNIENAPYQFDEQDILGGRKSTRAMPVDHMPLCGPAPDYKAYLQEYQGLHHGPRHKKFVDAPYHQNLFVNAGLGARGFLSAPLLAHYLAALISGKEVPLPQAVCDAIHPGRFIIRNLSKK